MNRFFAQRKKNFWGLFLIVLVSFLGIFVLNTEEVKAYCNPFYNFDSGGCLAEISLGLFSRITQLFGNIIQIAVNMLEGLLNWSNFIKADIVQIGWKITRDLANMFFVLILLVIAFATILRVETYGMKALLPKLIAAALLINFSLVIGGAIIDFSQVMTDFFISKAGGDAFQTNIMNATQAIRGLIRDSDKEVGQGIEAIWNSAFGSFLNVIFLLILLFVMGAYALFLIIRIVALWFLLILAPIVWILWILPRTRNLWDEWWSNFIKWSIFAPASAFFIYLAIISYKTLLTENIINALKANDYSTLLPSFARADILLQYLLIIGILFGGLIVAQRMGVYGGQKSIDIAKGAGKGAARWAGRRARMATAPAAGKISRGLARFGLPTFTRPLRGFSERERAAFAETEKKYKGWTSDNLKSEYRGVNAQNKAAIAKILADRGDFNKGAGFGEKEMKQALKLAKRYNQESSILKARPDLAGNAEAVVKAVSKIKPADIEKLQIEAIQQQSVQGAIKNQLTNTEGTWRSSHLSKMPEINPRITVEIRKQIIEPNLGNFRDDVNRYLEGDAAKAIFGEGSQNKKIETVTPPGAGGRKISEEELNKAREALKQ